MKEINLEDIKQMVAYVVDTKDEKLIEDYALALRQMRIDAKDGIKYSYPTINLFNKKYYGNELEVKDGKIYVDGVDTGQTDVEFDGKIRICNNKIGGDESRIHIHGVLTANEDINANKLFTDNLTVKGNVTVEKKLSCDDISVSGDLNVNGKISCEDISTSGDLIVNGELNKST